MFRNILKINKNNDLERSYELNTSFVSSQQKNLYLVLVRYNVSNYKLATMCLYCQSGNFLVKNDNIDGRIGLPIPSFNIQTLTLIQILAVNNMFR